MTKAYQAALPEVFPHCIAVKEEYLAKYLAILVSPESIFLNGSSFAVTTDCMQGFRKLWCSEVSWSRIGQFDASKEL